MIDVETIARKWANVYELALPADLEGGYDAANNRILISDRLTPIQRRCVLAHEISHARHHDVGCKCDSATERRADMEAARMLVNQLEYQSHSRSMTSFRPIDGFLPGLCPAFHVMAGAAGQLHPFLVHGVAWLAVLGRHVCRNRLHAGIGHGHGRLLSDFGVKRIFY